MIALIRYQVLPETVFPAQTARHRPPVTLVTTDTLVAVRMLALALAVILGLVRRLAPHMATFVDVAPSTSPGATTEPIAKTNTADSSALARMAGSDP